MAMLSVLSFTFTLVTFMGIYPFVSVMYTCYLAIGIHQQKHVCSFSREHVLQHAFLTPECPEQNCSLSLYCIFAHMTTDPHELVQ